MVIWIVLSSTWTMDREGVSHTEMVGAKDKHLLTAVFCCTLLGDFLLMQLIYKWKTSQCHPRFQFPPGWHVIHAPNTGPLNRQWQSTCIISSSLMCSWLVRELKHDDNASVLVIMVNFKGQVTNGIHNLLEESNIFVALLRTSNTTD